MSNGFYNLAQNGEISPNLVTLINVHKDKRVCRGSRSLLNISRQFLQLLSHSVTRFGDILPLWQNINGIFQFVLVRLSLGKFIDKKLGS